MITYPCWWTAAKYSTSRVFVHTVRAVSSCAVVRLWPIIPIICNVATPEITKPQKNLTNTGKFFEFLMTYVATSNKERQNSVHILCKKYPSGTYDEFSREMISVSYFMFSKRFSYVATCSQWYTFEYVRYVKWAINMSKIWCLRIISCDKLDILKIRACIGVFYSRTHLHLYIWYIKKWVG